MNDNLEERCQAITKIISEEMVQDQSTLVEILKKKYGIITTQVQVSRDLRKLGIGKRKLGDKMVYELPESNQKKELLRLAIVNVQHNESMIVVKTIPALAPFVSEHLDGQENIGVLATLAGENMVFVTPISIKKIKETFASVCLAVYHKK